MPNPMWKVVLCDYYPNLYTVYKRTPWLLGLLSIWTDVGRYSSATPEFALEQAISLIEKQKVFYYE